MNLGEIIKELRIESNMTQEELGNLLGVQKAAIRKYENGDIINLKPTTIRKLCEIFSVSPWRFIFPEAQMCDESHDVSDLRDCVKLFEMIQEKYDKSAVDLLGIYDDIPLSQRKKLMSYAYDLYDLVKLKRKVQDEFKISSRSENHLEP